MNKFYKRLEICAKCDACQNEDIELRDGTTTFWYCGLAQDSGIFTTLIAGYIPKNGVIEGKMNIPNACSYRLEHVLLEE